MTFRRNGSLLVSLFLLCVHPLFAQYKNPVYLEYFEQYKDIAIEHMRQYKIPASIILAQGVLESGAGKSKLARESNNHFGIKCHSDWNGKKTYHDDDYRNECFRKYKRAEDSYLDHSLFLVKRPRYACLFELDIRDYKGWARGLQRCGYATDKAYANKLIKIIEDHELYRYDSGKSGSKKKNKSSNETIRFGKALAVYKASNGLIYVHARQGDSFKTIADELGFKERSLAKYNEVPSDFPLEAGDIVYLQKKKTKAAKPNYEHVVEVGESMHSISQKYGIKMKSLYKRNKKEPDYIPEEGDILRLR
ncbi:MAG: glucosaminidase domain-containing protein [Bacteroidales bacterium]|nr:glucosaminidase domain-containing protein [Bacteroidales bacterium]